MSKQKFSASEREALWLAYEKKCPYTRELLDISSFHIDHILPENLADDPTEFAKVKANLGLGADFDLNGFGNLLPCRPGANLQKGSLVLDPGPTHFFLGIASNKKVEVEKQLARTERRNNRGRALILLQQCLERGELSPTEVADMLETHREQPQEIFQLLEAMKFFDSSEVKDIAKADIEDLRNRPIMLGKNEDIEGITLTNDADEQVFVRTCKEYEDARAAGYYALTTFDIKMATFFERRYGLLKALEVATTPSVSFIAKPRVGITDLQLIPFSLFP